MKLSTTLAVAMAGISTMVIAQSDRDLGSHEHGSASLNIALDDGSVYLELETPWNNLVGFEHAPRTDEQHTLVDDTLTLLNQPEQLFSFEGTDCIVAETVLDNSIATEEGHEEHHDDKDAEHHDDKDAEHHDDKDAEHHDDKDAEHHDDKDAEHHDDKDAEHHDDKDEEHHDDKDAEHHDDKDEEHHDDKDEEHHKDEHASESDSHASLLASYAFTCNDVTKLRAIDVKLLELWSGFEDLDVQSIGPGGQALAELNPENIRVDITQIQ